MRSRLATASLVLSLALVLAACGGGSSDTASSGSSGGGASTTAADGGSSSGSDGGSSDASVDCAAIKTAATELLQVQLLAQIRDPESIASMKQGTIGSLDLDKFLAAMATLHALDSSSSPMGDPKAAIATYEQAAKEAKPLIDAAAPTQADIDAYNQSIGTTTEFLGHQTAIAGAMDAAGC